MSANCMRKIFLLYFCSYLIRILTITNNNCVVNSCELIVQMLYTRNYGAETRCLLPFQDERSDSW